MNEEKELPYKVIDIKQKSKVNKKKNPSNFNSKFCCHRETVGALKTFILGVFIACHAQLYFLSRDFLSLSSQILNSLHIPGETTWGLLGPGRREVRAGTQVRKPVFPHISWDSSEAVRSGNLFTFALRIKQPSIHNKLASVYSLVS